MQRHIKFHSRNRAAQHWDVVPPGLLRFLEFSLLDLPAGGAHRGATGGRECLLYVFSGVAAVALEGRDFQHSFARVGGRTDVFSGAPSVLYMPPQCAYSIQPAGGGFRAGLFSAPATQPHPPALVEDHTVVPKQVGQGSFQRTVYTAIGDNVAAQRLLAGETMNAPGAWSSFPPHKHDRSNPPQEAVLEEIYYFQVQPAGGFGFIWTYTAADDPAGFNSVFVIENGDTVLLPKGYHPVVAAPGCRLHYTWVLAGEERRYGAWAEDPKYAFLKNSG